MSETTERHGRCLCGGINVVAKEAGHKVGACHCKMCRRWAGAPFMEINCGKDVEFSDEANLSVFDSSEWAERGFCRVCGTHLFYRLKESGVHYVPVGLFDDSDDLVFEGQVFIDEKPAFYNFAEETDNLTGPELWAKYAPQEAE